MKNKIKCLNCGRELVEVKDSIAKKKTGHMYKCRCTPKNVSISVG